MQNYVHLDYLAVCLDMLRIYVDNWTNTDDVQAAILFCMVGRYLWCGRCWNRDSIPGILFSGAGEGHIQSLILASMLITISVLCGVIGLLGDVISANRKLLEEIQFELRKMDYGKGHEEMKNGEKDEE